MDKTYDWDIVLLTESRYVNPQEKTEYIENLLKDDQLLQEQLENFGLKVIRVDWANLNFDWSSTRFILFRTPWDYFDRYTEFFNWMKETNTKTTFINSYEIALWNIDKIYLKELQEKGIPILETHFIKKGDARSLQDQFNQTNWNDFILKPNISAAARHTYKLNKATIAAHEEIYQALIQKEDMMLQNFQYNILTKGEVSHMVFDGKHTHSILKIASPGDFRVQDDYGGSVHDYTPSKTEIELAEHIVKTSGLNPSYARVDLIENNEGNWALSELELIEPELWFRNHPESAQILAQSIENTYFSG